VQAELGYRYSLNGEIALAEFFFDAEAATYPEAQYFIERLKVTLE